MSWLRRLFSRRKIYGELSEEIRAHIEEKTAELMAGGMSRKEAEAAARREFGNVTLAEEDSRAVWRWPFAESFFMDVRYGVRMLMKNPGFSAVAVAALALGIGANAAMYTIVKGTLSWNMGLDNPDQIVLVTATKIGRSDMGGVSYPDFRDFRSETKSLSGLGAYQFAAVNLSDGNGLPERYFCVHISANGLSVVDQKPLLGRNFIQEDERAGAPAVLVLGYHVWRDRYALDPAILGKVVHIDEIPREVIGVMPPGRRFPEETDLWVPLTADAALEKRDNRDMMLFGRLGRGMRLASARAEFSAMAANLAQRYPDTNKEITAEVRPIMQITGVYSMRPLFLALFGAVCFVLLIACADVGNMLLSRASERSREISIRVAIGAGKLSIIRQLLIESLVLSGAGGILGWFVALGGLRWFDSGLGGLEKPVWLHLSLDRNALFYLAAISLGTGVLFGLAPALRLAKTDVNAGLKESSGYAVVGSKHGLRLSNALMAVQMALCVVLLAGAGLMIRSAVNLYSAPIGVNTAGVLTMRIHLPEAKYATPKSWIAFHDELKQRLMALPGVEVASVTSNLPLAGWIPFSMEFADRNNDPAQPLEAGGLVVGNNYFEAMQVQPRHGRLFLEADKAGGAPVIVVNESFAAKFWPREDVIGKHVRIVEEHVPGPWLTVIGVVPDILQNFRENLERDPLIYLPFAQKPQQQIVLVARTGVPPTTLADAFQREVQRVDNHLAVYEVRTLENRIAESHLTVSLFGAICSIFAGVATLLAAIGVYGVVGHAVSLRRQEIGLRMAIGATRRDIVRLVLAQGIRPLLPGMAVGLLLALAGTRILRAALNGVSPSDPLTFSGIVIVLTLVALTACYLPARRAVSGDPMVALRYE